MTHLTEKQINKILNGITDGVEMKNALLHVETCLVCQEKMPNLNKNDLTDLILREPVLLQENLEVEEKPVSVWNWKPFVWKIGFASVLLLIFSGILFLFLRNETTNDEFVKIPTNSATPTPLISPTIVSNPNENTAINNNSNLNTSFQIAPQNTNVSNTKSTNVEEKLNLKPTETVEPEIDINSIDRQELAKNINKIPNPLSGLESPQVEIRGNEEKQRITVKYPIAEVIKETQPVLSWNKVSDSDLYEVTVYDENYNVVYSKEVSGTNLKVSIPLKRGKKYQWQVKAKLKDAENTKIISSPSIFRIAKDHSIKKIDKNYSLWKKANIYFQEGLLDDAEKSINEILKQNPKDKLAIKFLQRIKNLRNQNQKPPTETKPAQ